MLKKGFTLIELLIVIAIISLLSLILMFSIPEIKMKSHDAQRLSDVNTLQTALALYHNDFRNYPIYSGYITGFDTMSLTLIGAGILSNVPFDPLNDESGIYRYYYQSTQGKTYMIVYYLETDSIPGKPAGENIVMP